MDSPNTIATSIATKTHSQNIWRIWLPRVGILIGLATLIYFAVDLGLRWRHWVWETTRPLRMTQDINRDYTWGRTAASEGYLNQYEKMQVQQPVDENWLDIAPLRLGVMTLWGKWSLHNFPAEESWKEDRDRTLTAPVLRLNLWMELVGVISAFFLARLWSIRARCGIASIPDTTSLRWFFQGWIPGVMAALLLWFNPAVVISTYGWPAWDLWVVPVFLLAALLASVEWWFTAGVVLSIGVMLNAQQWVAVPVFVLWSLVSGRPLRTLRLSAGMALGIALLASPWLITYIPADKLAAARAIQSIQGQAWKVPADTFNLSRFTDIPALLWIAGVLLAAVGGPWIGWLQLTNLPQGSIYSRSRKMFASPWAWRGIAVLTTIVLVMWPWCIRRNHADWFTGFSAAIALAAAVLLVRPRGISYLAAGSLGLALLLCMSVFHGSSAWYDCSFHFGTIHWPLMKTGMADNLPAILAADFNWPVGDIGITAITIPAYLSWHQPGGAIDITMKQLLLTLFCVALLWSGVRAGLNARRKDARILVALTSCWLIFFCFLPQMDGRFLLFAAGVSCICTGVSTGMTLLGMFLSLVSALMTLHEMLSVAGWTNIRRFSRILADQYPNLCGDNAGAKLLAIANGTHPDLGFAAILCALIFLYPERRCTHRSRRI